MLPRKLLLGGLEQTLHASGELAGVSLEEAVVPTPATVAGLSPELAEPIGLLLAAALRAGEEAEAAILGDPDAVAALREDVTGLLGELRLEDGNRLAVTFAQAEVRLDLLVDRGRLGRAALTLTRALDAAVPALLRAPAPVGPRHGEGCDQLDLPPLLCVAGPGPNVHEDDYVLLVDLDGDDTYHNAAGAADPTDGGNDPGGGLNAAVVVDLGGDDTFAGSGAAQGAGIIGGVGALVDAGGDDHYLITDGDGVAAGHGYGTAGVGILADLGGADDYLVENTAAATTFAREATGGGVGALGGVGVAVDLGAGDDSHRLVSRPHPVVGDEGRLLAGDGRAVGVGFGVLGGQGVFVDDGGEDLVEMVAAPEPIEPDDPRPLPGGALVGGFGGVYGPGVGAQASVGVAAMGLGPTTWRGIADVQAPVLLGGLVDGFGFGFGPAFGALYDAGGDDVYEVRMSARALAARRIGDGCACDGATAEAEVFTGETLAFGFGWTGGTGVVLDAAGDDRYGISHETRVEATASDERTAAAIDGDDVHGPSATATISGGANAAGMGAGLAGTGVLRDESGHEDYDLDLHVTAHATALAASADLSEAATVQGATAFNVWGQGGGALAGVGYLTDLGGADSYRAAGTVDASADPGGLVDIGEVVMAMQGGSLMTGVGVLQDVDGGADDVFATDPAYEACFGSHGEGIWRSCDDGVGVGVNA